ncbi:TetR/AcrR family transcriptional regulator [Zhongshania guokunii]|uniref:TetR/AcrR family transcriptional regulator n=1 Tax=Zhongshania guokunii TaxID=641783 RepID=A0ABV3UAR5_9GAMM
MAVDNSSPAGLRREPKQERSRRMVLAIEQAARKILLETGSEALTTTSLELVSGVPKASIYQYFPSLDAVKAEVFRHEIKQHFEHWSARLESQWNAMSLADGLAMIVDSAINLQAALIDLDADFYQSHSGYFGVWTAYDSYSDQHDAGADLLKEFFARHYPTMSSADLDLRAHAMGRAVEQTSYHILRDNPDYRHQPLLRDLLLSMALSFFSPSLI